VSAQGLNLLYVMKKPLRRDTLAVALSRYDRSQPSRTHSKKNAELLTLDEIRAGLKTGQMEVYFQPKVNIAERRVVGAECLARWRHPARGLVTPDCFVSVIEDNGLIDEFTLVVFRMAVRQMALWKADGREFKISVNVSMDNLHRLALPDELVAILHEHGVSASSIMLEITETRLAANLLQTMEVITRLRLKGFGLSIDDFGTGYSTMENLKRIPFSELKIDRAFVNGADQDEQARAILESSVGLGKTFSLNMVAEGVETQTDWDLVSYVGCHEVQGYFVARPMPAGDFVAWADEWNQDKLEHRQ